MKTLKKVDVMAICLMLAALFISLYLAFNWKSVEANEIAEPSKNELAKINANIALEDENTKIEGTGALFENNQLSIVMGGTYELSGTLSDGQIVVDVDSTERVILILNEVLVSCKEDSALLVNNSGNLVLYLKENTKNSFYSGEEQELNRKNAKDDTSGGAITLKDSALICGSGQLFVYGYLNNGLHCSNDLNICDGNLSIYAVNNGIKGKDSLSINGGNIYIEAGNAGLKSGEAGNSNSGFLTVNAGKIEIASSYEGTEANQIVINGGDISIISEDDGMNANGGSDAFGGGAPGGPGGGGAAPGADGGGSPDGGGGGFGRQNGAAFGGGFGGGNKPDFGENSQNQNEENTNEGRNFKNFKHGNMPTPNGDMQAPPNGEFQAPPNGDFKAPNNNFQAPNGDKGFNGGGDMPNFENDFQKEEMPQNAKTEDENGEEILPSITINGGTLCINAQGDGLDSNGDLIINGGIVVVDGPTNGANGALDSGSENGGKLLVNGGTLLAIGSSGMAETPEEESKQKFVNKNASFSAGDLIEIKDKDGNLLYSHNAAKSGDSIVFSCEKISNEEEISVYVNGDLATEGSKGFGAFKRK